MTEMAGGGPAKGRMLGFVALGALLLLVGVAFYSSRDTSASRPPETAAPPAAAQPPVSTAAAPQPDAAPPRQDAPLAAPDLTHMPRAADTLARKRTKGSIVTAEISDIALSPQARLLAERLKCVCGCPDTLAVCVCKKTPGSRDMKKYLQELVSAGKTPSEVESAMVARYGEKVLQ